MVTGGGREAGNHNKSSSSSFSLWNGCFALAATASTAITNHTRKSLRSAAPRWYGIRRGIPNMLPFLLSCARVLLVTKYCFLVLANFCPGSFPLLPPPLSIFHSELRRRRLRRRRGGRRPKTGIMTQWSPPSSSAASALPHLPQE